VDSSKLDALAIELKRARTVPADAIPSNVITMNSRVTLRDLATSERISVTLVFPDAPAHDGRPLPVLSPFGLALLGCRVGDVLDHGMTGDRQRLLIEKLEFQPEAHGNLFM
jgi:regulator of nucleoside diphosphate kinase